MPRYPTALRRRLLAAVGLAASAAAPSAAQELRLQGLFCNEEEQLDRALARMGDGLDPQLAAELENRDAVACTWVDRLHYRVRHPVRIGAVKYEASLTGVVVGEAVRPVSPPIRMFFATPEPIAAAVVERRT
jgi:hypothetical protein